MPVLQLRAFSHAMHDRHDCDDKHVDFSSVGLYLPGLQTALVTVTCATTTIVSCWILPPTVVSAVRNLTLTLIVNLLLMLKPIRVGRARGIHVLFNALRPCPWCVLRARARATPKAPLSTRKSPPLVVRDGGRIYICSLVVEQLSHACDGALLLGVSDRFGASQDHQRHAWLINLQTGMYVLSCLLLALSAGLMSRAPRSESDVPFNLAVCALSAIAFVPPILAFSSSASTSPHHGGPLCDAVSPLAAGERIFRAATFASVYVTLVYASCPYFHQVGETLVWVARVTSASVWTLVVPTWALAAAPAQIAIVIATSLRDPTEATNATDQGGLLSQSMETVPLNARNDGKGDASEYMRIVDEYAIHLDAGALEAHGTDADADAIRVAIAQARTLKGVASDAKLNRLFQLSPDVINFQESVYKASEEANEAVERLPSP